MAFNSLKLQHNEKWALGDAPARSADRQANERDETPQSQSRPPSSARLSPQLCKFNRGNHRQHLEAFRTETIKIASEKNPLRALRPLDIK